MKITTIGRKCTIRESFKEHAEKKLNKIERFFGDSAEAKITATVEKNYQVVEITVMNNGMVFRAEERSENMNDALDLCVGSLIRQIRKNKTRIEKRMKAASFDLLPAEFDEPEEKEFDLVRTKIIKLRPETVEEAILKMNLVGHMFYVFCNAETGSVCVVYARKDGGYGLIEPELV
ncbi:MAG TPA: ribosome-associated translation inhibitor RaiA [Ruminococcaceae bacterium]|nr:ribosome-associated translation inhibitor RaiA [Oscillospiraceae bacterium]